MCERLELLVLWTTQNTRRWRGVSHSCRTASAPADVVGMMSVVGASVPLQFTTTCATWLSAIAHVSLSPSRIRAPAGVEEAKAVCAMCKAEARRAWRESAKPGRSPEHVQRNRSRLSPLESLMSPSPSHAFANCLRPAAYHASWPGSRLAMLAHWPESQERHTPCSRGSPASRAREGHFEAQAAQAAQARMLQELDQRRSGGPHRVLHKPLPLS